MIAKKKGYGKRLCPNSFGKTRKSDKTSIRTTSNTAEF
jgi:hypothetical protein